VTIAGGNIFYIYLLRLKVLLYIQHILCINLLHVSLQFMNSGIKIITCRVIIGADFLIANGQKLAYLLLSIRHLAPRMSL
jgi:hypothetical protein